MVATTPKFFNRLLRVLASDWQVSPILQIKSAQFFSVYSGTDRALTNALITTQTANVVGGVNPVPANQNVNNWLTGSAFSIPALGTYGNLGYNNFKGPGIFQLNMGLARTFPVWEKRTIQLRAEAPSPRWILGFQHTGGGAIPRSDAGTCGWKLPQPFWHDSVGLMCW
jgi:hypothetical protein